MNIFTVGSDTRHKPPESAPKMSSSETESRARLIGVLLERTFSGMEKLGTKTALDFEADFFAAHFFGADLAAKTLETDLLVIEADFFAAKHDLALDTHPLMTENSCGFLGAGHFATGFKGLPI